jgi:glucose/arabinose dehydrogenase
MSMRLGRISCAALVAAIVAVPACAESSGTFETSAGKVRVERMAGPFEYPWAIAFLPEPGAFLVTEREGALRVVRDGRISKPVAGVPKVRAQGQGGMLDVALDPDYGRNGRIYLTYSEPADGGRGRTALATGTLRLGDAPRLESVRVIFRQQPALHGGRHFGSRIVFSDDGKLYLTLGDRGNRDRVQDLSNHLGKTIRLNPDGSVPDDNPFVGRSGARPEIWSYGHRNPQGAAKRPSDGAYFTVSHGAAGGDEVNRPQPGKNYGWPEVSYGTHYSGREFSASSRADVEPPLLYWDPSIAPSGAAFYEGELFPAWRGNLFVGALRARHIARLDVNGDRVTEAERLLPGEFGRIRDIRVGPKGALWFAVDSRDGGVYQIVPAR